MRGWWNMVCWNGLSPAQQFRLITVGNLPFGSTPGPGKCDKGAEVGVETQADTAPGPRFYCRTCAIKYLSNPGTFGEGIQERCFKCGRHESMCTCK